MVTILLLSSGCGDRSRNVEPPSQPLTATSPTDESAPYEWADGVTPSDSYAVAFVRGISTQEALSALGQVRRPIGPLSSEQVVALASDLSDPETYETPPIVQIGELDGGVIIFSPSGFRPVERLGALSSKSVAAAFSTTVELDTSIEVARKGRLIREFDPFSYDAAERRGALPQERGLA